jgi:hypothetical protein
MRGTLVLCCFFFLAIVVFPACTDSPPSAPEQPVTVEGDEGSQLFPWALGPIEGVTTVWHPAPAEITVPIGTTIRLKCADPVDSDLKWNDSFRLERAVDGTIATVQVMKEGVLEVSVRSERRHEGGGDKQKPGQATAMVVHSCRIIGVALALDAIKASGISVSAATPVLNDQSTNTETMRAFFEGGNRTQSISVVREVHPGHYVTARSRIVEIAARAEDSRFASLMEVRVPGYRPSLGTIEVLLATTEKHVVEAGPPHHPRRITIETYHVRITEPKAGSSIEEGKPVVFTAVTEPAGFENQITWLSSTRFGTGAPVLGRGPRFAATFRDIWGPHPESGATSEWLGVRADDAVFDQDEKFSFYDDMTHFNNTLSSLEDELGKRVCCVTDSLTRQTLFDSIDKLEQSHQALYHVTDLVAGLPWVARKALDLAYGDIAADMRSNMSEIDGQVATLRAQTTCIDLSMSGGGVVEAVSFGEIICNVGIILLDKFTPLLFAFSSVLLVVVPPAAPPAYVCTALIGAAGAIMIESANLMGYECATVARMGASL